MQVFCNPRALLWFNYRRGFAVPNVRQLKLAIMKTPIKKLYGWELTPWYGNPNLGIISYLKLLKNPFNGRQTKVWIWVTLEGIYSYTVSGNNEYSYAGGFNTQPENMSEAIITIEDKYNNGLLFK